MIRNKNNFYSFLKEELYKDAPHHNSHTAPPAISVLQKPLAAKAGLLDSGSPVCNKTPTKGMEKSINCILLAFLNK